jgi:hypothetical protein
MINNKGKNLPSVHVFSAGLAVELMGVGTVTYGSGNLHDRPLRTVVSVAVLDVT